MKSKERIAVVFCVEKGILENQSMLLASSGIQFSGDDICFFAYSPRKNYWPRSQTVDFLKQKGVPVYLKDHNKKFESYPIANKVLGSQYFESKLKSFDSIMFVDSDTVFLNDVSNGLDLKKPALFLRPVDNKGPGSEGDSDKNDFFWKKVFSLCGVDLPEPAVWTTVRPHYIRNYFNAGFVWAHRLEGFFQQWYKDFLTIVESELRPFGWTSRDGNDYRCLDQVALAVTATRYQEYLQILPETYNYPIPFRPLMKDREGHPKFQDLVHVHYHKWFQHPNFLNHVASEVETSCDQYKWLSNRLPLLPTISCAFKK